MGNNAVSFEKGSPLKSSPLRPIKWIKMEHFGEVQVLYDQENRKEVIMKEYSFIYQGESKYQFIDKVKNLNRTSPYLVQMVRLSELNGTEESCGSTSKIVCYFQALINQYKSEGKHFTEKEVLLFVDCLLKGEVQLNDYGNYHGDINPDFIYWNREKGFLNIFDSVFFDTTKAGYYRARTGTSYMSPEILDNLSEKRAFPNFNPYKSDVFSIGMVALHCMTLTDPIIAYDMCRFQIDEYHVENLLRISSKRYSEVLVKVTRTMLSDRSRPTAKQLVWQLNRLGLISQPTERTYKSDKGSVSTCQK